MTVWNSQFPCERGQGVKTDSVTPPVSESRTSPSVISHPPSAGHILESTHMTLLFPPQASRRAPRTCFAEATPAVVRCQDGRRVAGKLQVISLTGGLLCLSKPLDKGSQVKVMFVTHRGSVLGTAEMLSPVSGRLQAFKFVGLYDEDRLTLQSAIQLSLDQNCRGQGQMEKYRAW